MNYHSSSALRTPAPIGLLVLLGLALASCSSPVTYVKPREWSADSTRLSVIRTAAPVLSGRRIFLDPGHGGDDRVNRGPAGEAVEADVNLRVGLALREYLQGAGAVVVMSRDRDMALGLRDRVALAVNAGAEIFISMHHNATDAQDNSTNYSSVYYHSREGVAGYHPSNHDLARYIERDLAYAMRNPPPPFSPTFDGTLSDYDIYPGAGFAVLRDNPLPAVLIEGSFHTHPPEEHRLAVEEFNRIEAWGIFLGLVKYFRAGVPRIALLADTVAITPRPQLLFTIGPGRGADPNTFQLYLDGRIVREGLLVRDSLAAWIPRADILSGRHTIAAVVRNSAGNSSWPFRRPLIVQLPAQSLAFRFTPRALPRGLRMPVRITCSGIDTQNRPLAEGSPLRLSVPGSRMDTVVASRGSETVILLDDPGTGDSLRVRIRSGSADTMLTVPYVSPAVTLARGTVRTSLADSSLGGVAVSVKASGPGALTDTTSRDGLYAVFTNAPVPFTMDFSRDGYFLQSDSIEAGAHAYGRNIALQPVAGGRLHGQIFVLDARYSGETDPAHASAGQLDMAIVGSLRELLLRAGAEVNLIASGSQTLSEEQRAQRTLSMPRGTYLRVDASLPPGRADAEIWESVSNRAFASTLLNTLGTWLGWEKGGITAPGTRFYRDVAMATISIQLPAGLAPAGQAPSGAAPTGAAGPAGAAAASGAVVPPTAEDAAWALFAGILASAGVDGAPASFAVSGAALPSPGQPAPVVWLRHTFRHQADFAGRVRFPRALLDSAAPTGTSFTIEGAPNATVIPESVTPSRP